MRAIICGASIEGLTAAWWLNHAGWDVLVIEKSSGPSNKGYMIDVLPSQWDVPNRMGLLSAMNSLRSRAARIVWMNLEQKEVAELKYVRLESLVGPDPMIVTRGDISRSLVDVLSPGIQVRFSRSVTHIRCENDFVSVDLTDGRTEAADILIGADGVRSRVRDIVFGDQQRYYRYLGYRTAGFVVWDYDLARKLGPDIKLMTTPGKVIGLCPMPGGRVAACFAYEAPSDSPARSSVDELRDNYPEFGWLIPQVLSLAPSLTDRHHEQALQVDVPRWFSHRVALVGDACFAGSAPTGQEASLLMSSGYVLADALNREATPGAAFESYEKRLRPSLDRRQAMQRRLTKWLVPATAAQILLRNAALTLANQPLMGWLLKGLAWSRFDGALAGARRS